MTKSMSDDSRVGDSMADNCVANMSHSMAETMAGNTVSDHAMANTNQVRVGGGAVISHLGHVAGGVVGVIVDVLDAAVGQVDGVGAVPDPGAVVGLGLLEGGAGVVVRHGVLVGVGGDLRQVVVADAVRDSMTDHTMADHTMADHTMTNEPMADTTMAH